MLVCKFGGTSVGSPEAIRELVSIVDDATHRGRVAVVVVSAFSGVTDALVAAARSAEAGDPAWETAAAALEERHLAAARDLCAGAELEAALELAGLRFRELRSALSGIAALRELSSRSLDLVMATGELLSSDVVARAFRGAGIDAAWLDSRAVVRTDADFGSAACLAEPTRRAVLAALAEGPGLRVAAGFIGSAPSGATTTLGRGGSDLSAAILGAALDAEEIEIWTDVDGIMSADPRVEPDAFLVEALSYEEAMELSHFGAKVLYAPTVRPAMAAGIPIRVRNTFRPGLPGTVVVPEAPACPSVARAIASIRDAALLRLQGPGLVGVTGAASRLLGGLARAKVNVMLITQASSEHSICLAVLPADAARARDAAAAEFEREVAAGLVEAPILEGEVSILAVVGAAMRHSPGVAAKVFGALGRAGVNIVAIAQGSSELNISALVARADERRALRAVHAAFFGPRTPRVELFLAGAGLVGGALLRQLATLADAGRSGAPLPRAAGTAPPGSAPRIRLAGVANSRRMVLAPDDAPGGLDPATAAEALAIGSTLDEDAFAGAAARAAPRGAVLCDCTAGEPWPDRYEALLAAGVAVVAANKRGPGGPLARWRAAERAAAASGARLLVETSVGAGLPVLSTLADLRASGDRVLSIEAVVSGTLGYLFSAFDGTRPFSALVDEAVALGYAEPDQREDLLLRDAARKALVLGRAAGLDLEAGDLEVTQFLPADCAAAPDSEAFRRALAAADAGLEERRAEAAARGKVLRCLVVVDVAAGTARVGLGEYPAEGPFGRLEGPDNLFMLRSARYGPRPLAISGPGAGAEVTAAGVLADALRCAARIT